MLNNKVDLEVRKGIQGTLVQIAAGQILKERVFFFNSNNLGASQFWKGLHKVKHLFHWGAEYHVRKGDKVIRFWHGA